MACVGVPMPRMTVAQTVRQMSWWRLLLFTLGVYVIIRLAIPWLVGVGVPFWARALFLAMGAIAGVVVGPWLYPRRR